MRRRILPGSPEFKDAFRGVFSCSMMFESYQLSSKGSRKAINYLFCLIFWTIDLFEAYLTCHTIKSTSDFFRSAFYLTEVNIFHTAGGWLMAFPSRIRLIGDCGMLRFARNTTAVAAIANISTSHKT